jgi:glutamate dehydrogenase
VQDKRETLEQDKVELLDAAAELACRSGGVDDEPRALAAFLRRYYRHVAAEDLVGREAADVAGAALSHRRLAASRPQGTARVRVLTPTPEEDGWSATGHSVVEVVVNDMPFLVDSVTAELSQHGRAIHLVVHPQLVVRRDVAGELHEVCDASSPAEAGDGAEAESWMHIEIDRESDAEAREALTGDLQRVLRDVRETVEDWPKMQLAAVHIAHDLVLHPPPGLPEQEVVEATELLRWLADDHFTFMGYREYMLDLTGDDGELRGKPGTGLGILRADQSRSESFGRLPRERRERARDPHVLVLAKANSRSTVHRPAYLDYVGVKVFDESGAVVGERRFLGLFTSAAYNESILRIPVLRRKAAEVLSRSGFTATGHSGKDLLQILETYPRDELFQISVEDLQETVLSVLHLQERRQLRLFLRKDDYGRFISCLVYLPRDRYTTQIRHTMERILLDAFEGQSIDYTALVSDSVLARLHFVVRVDRERGLRDVDPAEVEARLVRATRSWDDDFADALAARCGEERAAELSRTYANAFPEAYKEDLPAQAGVDDILQLESLDTEGDLGLSMYKPPGARPGETRLKLFHVGEPVSLSLVLPRLQQMGVEVVDEHPYAVQRSGRPPAWVYDFGLRYEPSGETPAADASALFQSAFAAVWSGATESDGFNALVLRAGLTWRQAMVLRAYAKYLRQVGSTFSQSYIEECLTSNMHIARLLVRLFEARFDPDHVASGDEVVEGIHEEIGGELEAVESLDQDRILRSMLGTIDATLRTNYFQTGKDGQPKAYLSIKLDSKNVPDLPRPRPKVEIWVYSPRFEGVHLRFGAVARGGLRWSDRREDFRTEVLGLVKAQMVKNAVIVPVGAKGGFVLKRPPAVTGDAVADREALMAEGIASYQTFISGMLDLTDNLVAGEVVPPERVVRHDSDDSYLVVAADKGTATFSDIANGVAKDYGFWLGDAFASGGSVGYDHKAMGITARGAWESVKRHFREMGVDTQSQDFTVMGVGDMSGDVFGNGMLLSEHIRLLGAFDHRHIFLDPDPDPATSYAERRRLFDLPRSSWADYDAKLISAGGGVHARSAKSIPITPQVRAALGLPDDVEKLSPPELLHVMLSAPVDLLWNGGIGTYVKAATESNADVGDKANDAIRVDGRDLRAKVVGEGGNLGFTQLGRIEFALIGGRINTDAIDNSAGVDTSDHEVNIKILLDRLVHDGVLSESDRNALLAEMTDDVARHVLAHNYDQNVLLGNGRSQASVMLSVHQRFIKALEARGALDRKLEFLPTNTVLEARLAAGIGLTSSELAVLVAYSKITLTEDIVHSELPDEAWFQRALVGYFPKEIISRYGDRLSEHPLRQQIITTCVSNDLVNRGGVTMVFRAQEETGAGPVEIARAFTVVREVYEFERFWDQVAALDNQVPTDVQTTLYLEGRRLIDRCVRWLLQSRRAMLDVAGEIEHFGAEIAALRPHIPNLLVGSELERLRHRASELEAKGVPADLAMQTAALLDGFSLLDVVEIAVSEKRPALEVASVYFALSEHFEVDKLLSRITALPRADRWSALARSSLRYDLYAALAGLTSNVLRASAPDDDPAKRIEQWEEQNAEGLSRARGTLDEIVTSEKFDLATMSVALRTIRTLLRS